MRSALVLGAGGFVGQAFHLGALCMLQELTGFDGRTVDALVGTSAGSLVAAGLAGGLSAADLTAELLGEPLSREGAALRLARKPEPEPFLDLPAGGRGPLDPAVLLSIARRPFTIRPAAVLSGLLPAGRTSTDPIARSIRYLHGDSWPNRDLRICAVRVRDARRVVFGTPDAPPTDVGTAVAASCAIPAYFRPVRVANQSYVDGGVHSPTNADVLVLDEPELVVVLSPMSLGPGAGPRVDLAVRLAVRRYLAQEVRRLRHRGAQVVVIQPGPQDLDVMGLNPMRGSRVDKIVRTASESVRARIEAQPSLATLLAQA
ncbi:MAG: Patatin [Frankiales bacterium]|nr:Patatin [Frankiales bacterium]